MFFRSVTPFSQARAPFCKCSANFICIDGPEHFFWNGYILGKWGTAIPACSLNVGETERHVWRSVQWLEVFDRVPGIADGAALVNAYLFIVKVFKTNELFIRAGLACNLILFGRKFILAFIKRKLWHFGLDRLPNGLSMFDMCLSSWRHEAERSTDMQL